MSNEKIGKTRSGRVWHIVDDNETLCGKMVESAWELKSISMMKSVKLCKGCTDMLEELAEELPEEIESLQEIISALDAEEVFPVKPLKRKNPHRTW